MFEPVGQDQEWTLKFSKECFKSEGMSVAERGDKVIKKAFLESTCTDNKPEAKARPSSKPTHLGSLGAYVSTQTSRPALQKT